MQVRKCKFRPIFPDTHIHVPCVQLQAAVPSHMAYAHGRTRRHPHRTRPRCSADQISLFSAKVHFGGHPAAARRAVMFCAPAYILVTMLYMMTWSDHDENGSFPVFTPLNAFFGSRATPPVCDLMTCACAWLPHLTCAIIRHHQLTSQKFHPTATTAKSGKSHNPSIFADTGAAPAPPLRSHRRHSVQRRQAPHTDR